MHRAFTAFAVWLSIAAPAFADQPENALGKLRGTWARADHASRMVIKGKAWAEYLDKKPGVVNASGKIELPVGKDYALVKASHNFTFWLFSAVEKTMAVETFAPDGTICETGRILYRSDFAP